MLNGVLKDKIYLPLFVSMHTCTRIQYVYVRMTICNSNYRTKRSSQNSTIFVLNESSVRISWRKLSLAELRNS